MTANDNRSTNVENRMTQTGNRGIESINPKSGPFSENQQSNPLVRHDIAGTDVTYMFHRTTPAHANSTTKKGVDTQRYGGANRQWGGRGWYGGSSVNISDQAIRGAGRNPSDYNTIIGQPVRTGDIVTLDPKNPEHARFIAAQRDDEVGRIARDQYRIDWREQDVNRPQKTESAYQLRDRMEVEVKRISGDAAVVRWKNPDGTYTLIARKQSALVGRPTIVGWNRGGKFVAKPGAPAASSVNPKQLELPFGKAGKATPPSTSAGTSLIDRMSNSQAMRGLGKSANVVGGVGTILQTNELADAFAGRVEVDQQAMQLLEGLRPSDFEVGHQFSVTLNESYYLNIRVERNMFFVKRFYIVGIMQ